MRLHQFRRLVVVLDLLRRACRAVGGAEMSLLVGTTAAGLAVLFAVGAVSTSGPSAAVGGAILTALAGSALGACLLARRGRPRPALLLLGVAIVGVGVALGVLYRWPLAGPYGILLAYSLVLPNLSGRERHAAILLAIPLATLAVSAAAPDPNRPAAVMAGPLGQVAVGIVVGLLLLTLERARRAVEDERARYRTLVEEAPVGIVRVDSAGRIRHANPAAAALFGVADPASLEGRSIVGWFVDPEAARRLKAELLAGGTAAGEVELRRADGSSFLARQRTRLVGYDDSAGEAVGFEGLFEDVTAERATARTAGQLAALVESADDAIVGLDADGRVMSWNPAAVRLFGRPAEAATGRRLSEVLGSPAGPDAGSICESVARALAGQPVRSLEREITTSSGERQIVSLTISPIADAGGRIVGASLVARDVTNLRRLERELGRIVAERSAVLDALRRIDVAPSLEATADAVARELSTTDGFASAAVFVFETDGVVRQVSSWCSGERSRAGREPLLDRGAELVARAAAGPWLERLEARPPGSYRTFLDEHGVRQLIYVPLTLTGQPVGLLALGLLEADQSAALERVPAAAEFAAVVAALLGPGLRERWRTDDARTKIRTIIEGRSFATCFQPIVDLASGAVRGYEALTRFADGVPPDRVFADAAACGLGQELELVTLEAALEAAAPLPANVFLNLNVSPDLVLAREPLATILRRSGWGTVLEITEHAPIADYQTFRGALAALARDVRLAIDDAGAGYASLRHIFELRPDFVKLDRWLVAGVDHDPSRAALVAGMVNAAERTGYAIVAEGLEREPERRALLELGVRLGQGFLLGRPAPAETWGRGASDSGLRPVLDSLGVSLASGGRAGATPSQARPPEPSVRERSGAAEQAALTEADGGGRPARPRSRYPRR